MSRLLIVCLCLILIGLQYKLFFSDGGLKTLYDLKKKATQQIQLNKTMAEKNQHIKTNIDELKSGKEALEEEARQDLGLIKSDEVYYHFIEQ